MEIPRRFLVLTAILLGAAARLYAIQAQSIWFDEGWSAFAAVQPTLWDAAQADLTNPPLYYMLLHVNVRLFGDSAFSLRWFSLLCGLLTIPLCYQLARRLFNEQAGGYAALLAAVLPLLWWASQEARMYTLLALLVLIAALAWHQLLRKPTRTAWLALLASEVALLYTHNTGPVAALWLNAATLLAWLVGYRRPLGRWIAGQIAVGLLWLPWFWTRFVTLQEANSAVVSAPQIGLPLFSHIWQAFWVGVWSMVDREPVLLGFSALIFLLTLALIPWRKPAARWLVTHALLLIGGLLLGLGILGNELHGRYLVMAAPLLLIPVGAGIAHLPSTLVRWLVSGLFVTGLFVVMALAQNPAYQHDDARGMVRHYADTLTENDTVLAWSYADRYDLWYYWDRLGVQARRVTLPEGGDLDIVLPLLPEDGDVALNVWYTQRADFRGMMACVLGSGTINPPDTFTVYGMSSLRYDSPALDLPDLRPFEGTVLDGTASPVASIEAVGALPPATADRGLCLPLEITVSQDTDADFKAAVIVRNRYGWEIARADAVFATANQRTTSQLEAGERAAAYPLLWLPVGTPSGRYDVRLRIYDETRAPSGYDLASPQSPSAAKDLLLGALRVLPGADWARVQRETDLPVLLSDNARLVAHSFTTDQTANNGDVLPLTLLWRGIDSLPPLTLAGEDWSVEIPAEVAAHDALTLDWRQVRVPLDAPSGAAELRLPDGTVLGRLTVENLPLLVDEPDYETAVNVEVPGIGTLVGYTLETNPADRAQPLSVTLVWRARETRLEVSYTVFVQLIDGEGVLVAQSDAIPAQNTRPTTGWRPDEYILDPHALTFNERAKPGPAHLIVGMYDALTGRRLPIAAEGQNFIELPGVIEVK